MGWEGTERRDIWLVFPGEVADQLWPPPQSIKLLPPQVSPAPTLLQTACPSHPPTNSITCVLLTDGFIYMYHFSPLNSRLPCNLLQITSPPPHQLLFIEHLLCVIYSLQVLCMDLDLGFSTPAQLAIWMGYYFVGRGVLCIVEGLTVSWPLPSKC